MLPVIILFVFIVLTDLYAFKGLYAIVKGQNILLQHIFKIAYWTVPLIMSAGLLIIYLKRDTFPGENAYKILYFVIGFFVLFYVPKLFFILFQLVDDLVRLTGKIVTAYTKDREGLWFVLTQSRYIAKLGIAVLIIMLIAILHGIFWGKFNYQVNKITYEHKRLPASFNNLKIVHISDLHIGSFIGYEDQLKRAVEVINAQDPDFVFFTGDIVNNTAEELHPFIDILSKINSRHGNFSILGNHDYGDYADWESEEKKNENLEKLIRYHAQSGFTLLLNESYVSHLNGDSIAIVGVENWGNPPFPQHGDLSKSLKELNNPVFKILLSHDPSHWREEVLGKTDIALTLSGHTHGMQFGLNIAGFRWSPVKWKYKEWYGEYLEGEQTLIVTNGLGFIAFPGRVGSPPEINVITLVKKQIED